jgi:SRP40, C-terminal domain
MVLTLQTPGKGEANGAATSSSGGEAFRRVKDEEWVGTLTNGTDKNDYESAFGQDGYGFKAHQTLINVRGKDFRHEKTKKKRGSYRGGLITMASNSYKFDD